jgi:hypothetical protein
VETTYGFLYSPFELLALVSSFPVMLIALFAILAYCDFALFIAELNDLVFLTKIQS